MFLASRNDTLEKIEALVAEAVESFKLRTHKKVERLASICKGKAMARSESLFYKQFPLKIQRNISKYSGDFFTFGGIT